MATVVKRDLRKKPILSNFGGQPNLLDPDDAPNWSEEILHVPDHKWPVDPKKPKEDWESTSTSSSEDSTHPTHPRFVNPMYKDWSRRPFETDLHTHADMDFLDEVKESVEEEGISVHELDWAGRTTLWKCRSKEVAEYLVTKGAKVTHHNTIGANLVMRYAAKSREPVLEYILDELKKEGKLEEFINEQAKGSLRTPLMAAAVNDFVGAARILLDYGADPTIKDRKNNTALGLAKKHESKDVLELFKQSGIN